MQHIPSTCLSTVVDCTTETLLPLCSHTSWVPRWKLKFLRHERGLAYMPRESDGVRYSFPISSSFQVSSGLLVGIQRPPPVPRSPHQVGFSQIPEAQSFTQRAKELLRNTQACCRGGSSVRRGQQCWCWAAHNSQEFEGERNEFHVEVRDRRNRIWSRRIWKLKVRSRDTH